MSPETEALDWLVFTCLVWVQVAIIIQAASKGLPADRKLYPVWRSTWGLGITLFDLHPSL